MAPFLSFLNVVLNGLKKVKPKGYRACEVWEGKVIISKPKDFAYYIDSKVIWDPCSSKINKWWLVVKIPFGIDQLKKEKNSLKKKTCHSFFFGIAMHVLILQNLI
jgi:hypothetical protein